MLGHRVQILAGASKRASKNDAVPDSNQQVVEIPSIDSPLIFRPSLLVMAVIWLLRNRGKYDVVILNPDSLWIAPIIKHVCKANVHLDIRTLPVNVISTKRRLDKWLFWSMPLKLLSRSPNSYSFITERLRRAIEEEFDIRFKDYCIWASGVNTDHFLPRAPSSGQRNTRFQLFYHGSISLKRGLEPLIRATKMIDAASEVELVIVGDGPDREYLQELVISESLQEKVKFTGLVAYEQIPEMIGRADVCVCPLPDLIEWNVSSPLKVLEYMACGKPIISTPIAAHLDVLSNYEFVVWTHGFDEVHFGEAITAATASLSLISKAASTAPLLVQDRFQWRTHARVLSDHLMAALAAHGEDRESRSSVRVDH